MGLSVKASATNTHKIMVIHPSIVICRRITLENRATRPYAGGLLTVFGGRANGSNTEVQVQVQAATARAREDRDRDKRGDWVPIRLGDPSRQA